jgi:hypothetical protein
MTATTIRSGTFYGWRVVGGAFVLALFGWGMAFWGPPVFLSVLHERMGWPLALISTAITMHFLVGAVVAANLPAIYRRFGASVATRAGAVFLALGTLGWAAANAPWQLFLAAVLSGAGWGAMGAVAVNEIVSPWFVRGRPVALSVAYNGGTIGGVIFSPLWVVAIGILGFPIAAAAIAFVMAATMWTLSATLFSRTPQQMGLMPDGSSTPHASVISPAPQPRPGSLLWRDVRFVTLAAGMTLGLFAQIGLLAHLFSLLASALSAQRAGIAMGFATALAIAGRVITGWAMQLGADRRLVASACYARQMFGSIAFFIADGTSIPLLLVGVALFGIALGNSISLPPLIAQVEFAPGDVPRVVALIVAIAQGTYAFAPAAFGLIRDFAPHVTGAAAGSAPGIFFSAALVQALAIAAFLAGRRR